MVIFWSGREARLCTFPPPHRWHSRDKRFQIGSIPGSLHTCTRRCLLSGLHRITQLFAANTGTERCIPSTGIIVGRFAFARSRTEGMSSLFQLCPIIRSADARMVRILRWDCTSPLLFPSILAAPAREVNGPLSFRHVQLRLASTSRDKRTIPFVITERFYLIGQPM